MNSIIEELYYERSESEHYLKIDDEYRKLNKKFCKLYEKLSKMMNKNQIAALDKLNDLQGELESAVAKSQFIDGFKYGFKLAVEAFK